MEHLHSYPAPPIDSMHVPAFWHGFCKHLFCVAAKMIVYVKKWLCFNNRNPIRGEYIQDSRNNGRITVKQPLVKPTNFYLSFHIHINIKVFKNRRKRMLLEKAFQHKVINACTQRSCESSNEIEQWWVQNYNKNIRQR